MISQLTFFPTLDGLRAVGFHPDLTISVNGVTFDGRQQYLRLASRYSGPDSSPPCWLEREPDNKYDTTAIGVHVGYEYSAADGWKYQQIGYLPKGLEIPLKNSEGQFLITNTKTSAFKSILEADSATNSDWVFFHAPAWKLLDKGQKIHVGVKAIGKGSNNLWGCIIGLSFNPASNVYKTPKEECYFLSPDNENRTYLNLHGEYVTKIKSKGIPIKDIHKYKFSHVVDPEAASLCWNI